LAQSKRKRSIASEILASKYEIEFRETDGQFRKVDKASQKAGEGELFAFFSPQKISERTTPTKLDPTGLIHGSKPTPEQNAPAGESKIEKMNTEQERKNHLADKIDSAEESLTRSITGDSEQPGDQTVGGNEVRKRGRWCGGGGGGRS
jgi:hypothetical protein